MSADSLCYSCVNYRMVRYNDGEDALNDCAVFSESVEIDTSKVHACTDFEAK